MNGTRKSGNNLSKDFISEMSFTSSDRVQAAWNKASRLLPPGSVLAWMEGYYTAPNNVGFTSKRATTYTSLKNLKLFNEFYIIADGSVCDIGASNYFGKSVPDLTDNRFIMGITSNPGETGGSNFLKDHTHTNTLLATLSMGALYKFTTHYHGGSAAESGSGRFPTHYIYVWEWYFWGSVVDRRLVSDDNSDHTGSVPDTSWSGAHGHTIPNLLSGSSSPSISTPHSHTVSINPSSTVGSGSYPSATDHKPKYLSCVYLFKVI